MANLYYDDDADLSLLHGKTVAILGYGSQGHAHALNLRDSGVNVVVGLREESHSRGAAEAEGLTVLSPREAARVGDVIVFLAPDMAQPDLYREDVQPELGPGKTVVFAHGFNIRYRRIIPGESVDVSMIAPKAPGHRVRELFIEGEGTPALFAVHQDASGEARARALAYAKGIGCTRAGVIETTFAEETETDLFGEQVVLCGGVTALVRSAFETLVEAGYQPEVAYFECMHELKLIVDLMYEGGLTYMWHSVSDTAEHGGYTAGERIVGDSARREMQRVLEEIRSGAYADMWTSEHESGAKWFLQRRSDERSHPIEQVGARLRSMMSFLRSKTVPDAS